MDGALISRVSAPFAKEAVGEDVSRGSELYIVGAGAKTLADT